MPDKNGKKKETLRLDLVGQSCDQYKGADIIVFNTGHWWTHDKTSRGYVLGLQILWLFRELLTIYEHGHVLFLSNQLRLKFLYCVLQERLLSGREPCLW